MKLLFVAIVLMWCGVGLVGLSKAKDNSVNYAMLSFFLFTPFLPLIAKACGLL